MPEIKPTEVESSASIKVVGVGGAGGSAVDRMKEIGLSGVEFIAGCKSSYWTRTWCWW